MQQCGPLERYSRTPGVSSGSPVAENRSRMKDWAVAGSHPDKNRGFTVMRSNVSKKRRLKKLEDAAGPQEPQKIFNVMDDQARVDELRRQYPDAFIIHHVIVDPPVRDSDGSIITPARYRESGEPIEQITERA